MTFAPSYNDVLDPRHKIKSKSHDKKRGRPTIFSKKLVKDICRAISDNSCGLDHLHQRLDWFPHKSTIFDWVRKYPDFSNQYAQAKAVQVDKRIEEIIEAGRVAAFSEDTFDNSKVHALKIHADNMKWAASKLAPKIYGNLKEIDDLQTQHESLKKELSEFRKELEKKHAKPY